MFSVPSSRQKPRSIIAVGAVLLIVLVLTVSFPKRALAQTYPISQERDRRPHREVTITNSLPAQTTLIFRAPRGHAAKTRTAKRSPIIAATPAVRPSARDDAQVRAIDLTTVPWRHR
jgi:hypothetical protein